MFSVPSAFRDLVRVANVLQRRCGLGSAAFSAALSSAALSGAPDSQLDHTAVSEVRFLPAVSPKPQHPLPPGAALQAQGPVAQAGTRLLPFIPQPGRPRAPSSPHRRGITGRGYIRLVPPQKNGPPEGLAVSSPAVSPPGSSKHVAGGWGVVSEWMSHSCPPLRIGFRAETNSSAGVPWVLVRPLCKAAPGPPPPFLSFQPRLSAAQFPEQAPFAALSLS